MTARSTVRRSSGGTLPAPVRAQGLTAPVPPAPVPPALLGTLDRLAADPRGTVALALVGDGGTGKTAGLAAVRAVLRAAGVAVTIVRGAHGGRWPETSPPGAAVLVDDAHGLGDPALARLLDLVDADAPRVAITSRGWPRPPLLDVLLQELELRGALVRLGPLDRVAVTARAAARLGRTPPASLVDHVLRATAGVPRWVDLLLTGAAGWGPMPAPTSRTATPLPWELLTRAEDDLGPADGARRAVVLAIALGAAADAGSLSAVLGLPADAAHTALAEARGAGLLRGDGSTVPVVRQAVLAAAPADRIRALLAESVRVDLDRGATADALAARVGAVPVPSPALAAALRRAAGDLRPTDPRRAAELHAAACATDPCGTRGTLVVERAECELLAGDAGTALRLAEPLLRTQERGADQPGGTASTSSPVAPDTRRRTVTVVAAALAHHGLLDQAARLGGPIGGPHAPPAVQLAALACGAATPQHPSGRPTEGPPVPDPDLGVGASAAADALVLAGVRASLVGDGAACLPPLRRASVLLRSTGDTPPAVDTPEAIAALAAISGGDPAHARRALHAAVDERAGGPVASPRHHLLLAWCAMLAGAFDVARDRLGHATAAGRASTGRDGLLRYGLELGIARRTHDRAALVRAWPDARESLLAHGVDLFMLLPLAEITVAAARLDESHRVTATLAEAHALLTRCGEPVLWATPLHWAEIHAAIAAERPDAVAPHAAALVRGAQVSRHALTLADAGRTWMQVLAGRVDAPVVERVARRLHAAGLGWDGSRLAAHAAARSDEPRSTGHLLQIARDLQRSGSDGDRAPGRDAASPSPGTGARARPIPADGRDTAAAHGPGRSPVHAIPSPPTAADTARVDRPPTVPLTERELQVARLVVAGHTYREISERLYLSTKTVEHHVARMRQRLGLESRAALLAHLRAHLDPHPPA